MNSDVFSRFSGYLSFKGWNRTIVDKSFCPIKVGFPWRKEKEIYFVLVFRIPGLLDQPAAEIFSPRGYKHGASSSGYEAWWRERRHACHAPELIRRAANEHEVPDTNDNNLSRSDSTGRPHHWARRDTWSAVAAAVSPVGPGRPGPSFFPFSFRSPGFLPFFVCVRCPFSARDTTRFLSFYPRARPR